MPINSGGNSTSQLSFSTLRDYYGDSNPVSLSDYYRNGAYIKTPSVDAGSTESSYNSGVETNTSNSINVGSLNQTYKAVTPTVQVISTTGSTSLSPRSWIGEHNGTNWQSGRYSINYNRTNGIINLLYGAVWNGTILMTFQVNTAGFYYFQGFGCGDGTHQHRFQLYGDGLLSSDVDIYHTTHCTGTDLQRVQLAASTNVTAKGYMPSGQTYNWHSSTVMLFVNDDTDGKDNPAPDPNSELMWV